MEDFVSMGSGTRIDLDKGAGICVPCAVTCCDLYGSKRGHWRTSWCRSGAVSGLVMLLGDDYSLNTMQWQEKGDLAAELCMNASRPVGY